MKRLLLSILVVGSVLLATIPLVGCTTPSEPKPFPPPEGYSSWDEYHEEYQRQTGSPQPILEPEPSATPETITEPDSVPEPTPKLWTFLLRTEVSPEGAGSIDPASGKYKEGTSLTLTATPSSTYEYGDWRDTLGLTRTKHAIFDHWSGDASGFSSTITIIMDSSKEVVAHFAIVPIAPIEITAIELDRD